MRFSFRWLNGLVFGITHQYMMDFDNAEGNSFEEKMQTAPKVPFVMVFLGPLQLTLTW